MYFKNTVESPLALNAVNSRVVISSYSFIFVLSAQNTREGWGGWNFHREDFLLLGYLSQLTFMIFQTSCIGLKSRESLGHLKTDVPLISRMCFTDLRLIQKTLPCIKTNSFGILY